MEREDTPKDLMVHKVLLLQKEIAEQKTRYNFLFEVHNNVLESLPNPTDLRRLANYCPFEWQEYLLCYASIFESYKQILEDNKEDKV